MMDPFGYLTDEQLHSVIEATRSTRFAPPDGLDREVLRGAIQIAYQRFLIEHYGNSSADYKARSTAAGRIALQAAELWHLAAGISDRRYQQALEGLWNSERRAGNLVNGIPERTQALPDKLPLDAPIPTVQALRNGLLVLKAAADSMALEERPPRGNAALKNLIGHYFADVFERHFKHKAGCSGGGAESYVSATVPHGPYFRFVRELSVMLGIDVADDTIARYAHRPGAG